MSAFSISQVTDVGPLFEFAGVFVVAALYFLQKNKVGIQSVNLFSQGVNGQGRFAQAHDALVNIVGGNSKFHKMQYTESKNLITTATLNLTHRRYGQRLGDASVNSFATAILANVALPYSFALLMIRTSFICDLPSLISSNEISAGGRLQSLLGE